MNSKDIKYLTHGILCSKRVFADVIKLRILKQGPYSKLSGWAQCNHQYSYQRETVYFKHRGENVEIERREI